MDNFTPLTAPGNKKKKVNKLLIIGNLLLVVIIAFAGYFYYNNILITKEQKATGTEPALCTQNERDNCKSFTCEGVNRRECIVNGDNGDKSDDRWCLLDNNCADGHVSGVIGCPAGLDLSCGPYNIPGAILDVGGPGNDLGTSGTSGIGTCNTYAPIRWGSPGGNCQINCLCCPTGSRYSCTTSSNTYEYATTNRRKYICQNNNHADKYISSRPNPAYNSSLPPADNPLCFEDGVNNKDEIKYKCLDTLTTCAPNVCSCGGATVPSNTPTPSPTPSPVAGCTPRFYCRTSDHTCVQTSSTYTSSDVQCEGGPTCAQNLANPDFQIGQTTGICYSSSNTCGNNCNAATPTPTRTPTPIPSNTPTSTPTATPVISNTPTATPVISNTPTATPVATNTPTSTPVVTNTPGPSATPTEIILAKVSTTPSPTSTTQLLQTGVLKSFMYWIPAAIMMFGLLL